MDKKIIIANWKMRLTAVKAGQVADEFVEIYQPRPKVEVVICPTFTSIKLVSEKIKNQEIKLGAQDCFWEPEGAFTGAVSPQDLKELGCQYVIVGHSERRSYLNETNESVNKKVKAALKQGLIPVICVGETFEERQEGNKDFVVLTQVAKAIEGVSLNSTDQLIVAYEPVWVIGSGQAVEPEEAEHTHQVIKQVLIDQLEASAIRGKVKIIYGGSVDSSNIKDFFNQPNIDGALVGGASLNPVEFNELIQTIGE